jgi:dephospho-CoA kinase
VIAAATTLTVGLTGGIASGKSTVAGFLRDLGALVLDADRIARDVVAPGGPAHAEVVARFGRVVLDAAGGIDRARLGAIVFADADARRDLEAIVHPRVREEIRRRVAAGAAPRGIAVVEAALLVETGGYREYHRLVVVRAARATQVRRMAERDGWTPAEAARRIDAQASLEAKLAVADYVIDADTDLERTRGETAAVWSRLLADRDALASGRDLPPAG